MRSSSIKSDLSCAVGISFSTSASCPTMWFSSSALGCSSTGARPAILLQTCVSMLRESNGSTTSKPCSRARPWSRWSHARVSSAPLLDTNQSKPSMTNSSCDGVVLPLMCSSTSITFGETERVPSWSEIHHISALFDATNRSNWRMGKRL